MNKVSQCNKILAFIADHGSITSLDAYGFKCTRLAARIADLKKSGYPIITTMESADGSRYARYSLGE